MLVKLAPLFAAATVLISAAHAGDRHRPSLGSEIRVNQAHGQLNPNSSQIGLEKTKRRALGGDQAGAVTGNGSTAPVTCNQQNASSPACYSSTQQARPVTR